ncbi:hypothetical protein BKA62DRAFT_681899, partial [Auriculariales sp. MPI-PUGE-AT-0066]
MNTAHDRINLTRLVVRLQREVDPASDEWRVDPETLKRTHLHATAVARKIIFARELLARVEQEELDEPQSSSRQHANAAIAQTLDLAEDAVHDVQRRIAVLRQSEPKKPSLLASLPMPTEPAPAPTPSIIPSDPHSPAHEHDHLLPTPTPHDEPLALFPSTPNPPQPKLDRNLLPAEPPAFLSTSLQTQDHLSAQLAEMATLLKRGAEQFGSALEKDKPSSRARRTRLSRTSAAWSPSARAFAGIPSRARYHMARHGLRRCCRGGMGRHAAPHPLHAM